MGRLASLVKTVQGQYGSGTLSFMNFFYYTFFRLNRFIVYEMNLKEEIRSVKMEADYQFVSPSLEDLKYLREQKTYPREFYMDKVGGLESSQILLKGGEPFYIHWLRFPGAVGRFTRLKAGTVEITHLFSLPPARGRGLAKMAVAATVAMLKEQGYNKAVAIVHEGNIASIKTFESLDFIPVKYLKAFGRFNCKIDI